MKTPLTNKYLDFVTHVQRELSKPFSKDSRVIFSVFPSIGTGHFSIQLVETTNPFLIVRQWDEDLRENHQTGVYNLASVKIEEKKLNISVRDLFNIQALRHDDIEVKESSAITLDGVDFELTVNRLTETRIYQWRNSEQISEKTNDLIAKLVDAAGLRDKL